MNSGRHLGQKKKEEAKTSFQRSHSSHSWLHSVEACWSIKLGLDCLICCTRSVYKSACSFISYTWGFCRKSKSTWWGSPSLSSWAAARSGPSTYPCDNTCQEHLKESQTLLDYIGVSRKKDNTVIMHSTWGCRCYSQRSLKSLKNPHDGGSILHLPCTFKTNDDSNEIR